MSKATWEDRYRDTGKRSDPPIDRFDQPIQLDEMQVAQDLMGHMRHMATYWQRPTAATKVLLTKTGNPYKELPKDTRPISPSHSIGWMTIKQCGEYWEVLYGSNEFSSSFSAMARGRTLAEALYNVAQEG